MAYRTFISYRRDDDPALAEWLYTRLTNEFGSGDVFVDRKGIDAGEVFPKTLRRAVQQSIVFVVLIGQKWNRPVEGIPRLDRPHDFVRQELEFAMFGERSSSRLILPVLFGGATFPTAESLPTTLSKFCEHHAYVIPNSDYTSGISALVNRISEHLEKEDPVAPEEKWILDMIMSLLGPDEARVRRVGSILSSTFTSAAPTESVRGLSRSLYRIGPPALASLETLGREDTTVRLMLDLLATNWIKSTVARSLRDALVGSEGRQIAVECDFPEFTPTAILLKASLDPLGWPQIAIKDSDNIAEVLLQVHDALVEEFRLFLNATGTRGRRRETVEDERREVCRILEQQKADGWGLPVILKLSHEAALDHSLLSAIRREFPALNLVIASSHPEEIGPPGRLDSVFEPTDVFGDEERAFTAYLHAAQRLRRRNR